MQRTECACQQCQQCCRVQPGYLIPGDMERIAAHLGKTVDDIKPLFWASPGGVVMNNQTQRQFRIGTITPRYDRRKKACIFLSEDGQCQIHTVSPFGCAFFDTHQTRTEGMARSTWGLQEVLESPEYKALRATLPFAESYKPKGY